MPNNPGKPQPPVVEPGKQPPKTEIEDPGHLSDLDDNDKPIRDQDLPDEEIPEKDVPERAPRR